MSTDNLSCPSNICFNILSKRFLIRFIQISLYSLIFSACLPVPVISKNSSQCSSSSIAQQSHQQPDHTSGHHSTLSNGSSWFFCHTCSGTAALIIVFMYTFTYIIVFPLLSFSSSRLCISYSVDFCSCCWISVDCSCSRDLLHLQETKQN